MAEAKKLKEKVDTASKEMKRRVNDLADEIKELQQQFKKKANVVGEEVKESAQRLTQEVKELQGKLKEKFTGVGKEVEETAERLAQDAKKLKERVKSIVPLAKRSTRVPVRVKESGKDFSDPVMAIKRAGNRLFDRFWQELDRPLTPWTNPFALPASLFETGWPLIDISETEEKIQVKAELPGLRKDDIEVSLSGNSLTIRGEKSYRDEKKSWNNYLLECSYGSFHRSIPLTSEVESGKIKAAYKHGVLTVILPKTSAARQRMRRIKVKSA